uniref:Uncharacterized protein n=1 Tax=Anguilla anguilla TaxID=7936 RepID=A0A0E9T129_ANGAN
MMVWPCGHTDTDSPVRQTTSPSYFTSCHCSDSDLLSEDVFM